MIVQCCACQKIRKGKVWLDPNESDIKGQRVSHGYCPACIDQAYAELEKDRPNLEKLNVKLAVKRK